MMDAASAPARDPDAFRGELRGWLAANLPAELRLDDPRYCDPDIARLQEWERACYKAGLWGVTWPEEYGGHGLTIREHLIANQEMGRMPMPASVNSIGKELVGPILMSAGTEAQKTRFLPPILEMTETWCQGFSEPGAGSDLARLRTRAEKTATGWRINGQKIWTSLADRSDFCLLLARTGTVEDRHKGLVLFALPMDTPGIEVRPIRQIVEAEGFCETFLTDVDLPDDAVIGDVDGGWRAAVSVLSTERATNRMYRGARFQEELEHLVSVCREEPSLAPLLGDRAIRNRLAAIRTDIAVVQSNAADVVARIAAGQGVGEYGSLIKLHWSEAHQRFASFALELLSRAWNSDTPAVAQARARFQQVYLEGRAETIYAGTSEVQLNIIADRMLGLPRIRG